jgi:hypothetical protein
VEDGQLRVPSTAHYLLRRPPTAVIGVHTDHRGPQELLVLTTLASSPRDPTIPVTEGRRLVRDLTPFLMLGAEFAGVVLLLGAVVGLPVDVVVTGMSVGEGCLVWRRERERFPCFVLGH